MKKILLFGVGLLCANFMSAQVIFYGVSPEEAEGNYELSYAETTSWGAVPDLENPDNAVQEFLVLYEDGGSNFACENATNAADIAGHIAILRRGDCEFGLKALNAQNAGAIAVVIVNNEPGSPIGMAGGVSGEMVTIPVVMLTQADGEMFISLLEDGPVEVFIGSKTGYYDYDLGIKATEIVRPKYSMYPSVLANAGEYSVDVFARVYNHGAEDQDDVVLHAVIEFEGEVLYDETSSALQMAGGSSTEVLLPSFTQETWEEGVYTLTYTVTGEEEDEYVADNAIITQFMISDGAFSYATFDEDGLPNAGNGIRPADAVDFYSLCTYFTDANASEMYLKGMDFSAIKGSSSTDPSMEGEEVFLRVMKINGNFNDLDDIASPLNTTELLMESFEYTYDGGEDIQSHIFDVENQIQLEDNAKYLFCVGSYNDDVYVGSDPAIQYDENMEFYNQPIFPIEVGSGSFNPFGFQSVPTPAITMRMIGADQVGLAKEELAIQMNAFPSPANSVINVDFKGNEVKNVELVNITGQVVDSQSVTAGTKNTTINVDSVDAGVYFVNVTLTNNLKHAMRVVVSH